MSTGKARHVKDAVSELGCLADAPVNDRELGIFVDVVRIENEVFDSNVEIGCCILMRVFAVDEDVSVES